MAYSMWLKYGLLLLLLVLVCACCSAAGMFARLNQLYQAGAPSAK